jgi:cyclase
MEQLARGIFYEGSYLGVTLGGLVYPHGTITIDAPLRAEDARSWRSALLNQRGGTNRLLVNLDAHPDRTLGSRAMECPIVAQQKTAQIFRNRPTIFKGQAMETGSTWELYSDAIGMRWAIPDITFSLGMSLHWGGPEILLENHPGSTPGAIWVIIPEEKIVFVGDLVVKNQPPFLANADLSEWLVTLDLLMNSYQDYVIVSGRGGPLAVDSISQQALFLKDVMVKLERMEEKNALPEATEDLIPDLLAELSFTRDKQVRYAQRLRYGLYHYYSRRYRSSNSLEHRMEEDEE